VGIHGGAGLPCRFNVVARPSRSWGGENYDLAQGMSYWSVALAEVSLSRSVLGHRLRATNDLALAVGAVRLLTNADGNQHHGTRHDPCPERRLNPPITDPTEADNAAGILLVRFAGIVKSSYLQLNHQN
jgi:hypothetical protein